MNLREAAKREWTTQADAPNHEELQTGALLRIADACEAMSKNHQALINEVDKYQRWYTAALAKVDERDRTITALRGVITKLKKTPNRK